MQVSVPCVQVLQGEGGQRVATLLPRLPPSCPAGTHQTAPCSCSDSPLGTMESP